MKTVLTALLLCLYATVLSGQGTALLADYGPPGADGSDARACDEESDALFYTPLAAYESPFAELSRYNFSFVRYRRRGYGWGESRVTLDGIDLGDPVTGGPDWNLLTAVQNAPLAESRAEALTGGASSFGAPGGVREYGSDPLGSVRVARVGWMFADRRFRHGLRFAVASGASGGGWAFTLAGSRRWGRDRHIRGVWADEGSYFLSVAKAWNDGRHSLCLTMLGAPSSRGERLASTREAFALTGDPLYNPAWGWQQGRVRSSRVRSDFRPSAVLRWRMQAPGGFALGVSFGGSWGRSGYSSLDWYDAQSPVPDYYRYMPGFYDDPSVASAVGDAWRREDARFTQVDWEELYRVNRLADTLAAPYVLGSAMTAYRRGQMAAVFRYRVPSGPELRGGVRVRAERTEYWNRLDDLLGGAFLYDIDPYLIDDEYYGDKLQSDLRHPGRRVGKGDAYGYHYAIGYQSGEGWLAADMQSRNGRWAGRAGVQGALVSFFRDGFYEKELFPGPESHGRSPRQRWTCYALKAGASCRFSPRHSLSLDAACGDRAPAVRDAFLSPEYRNAAAGDPSPEHFLSGSLRYRIAWRTVALHVSGYVTAVSGAREVIRYYDDMALLYSDLLMSDIAKLYAGVEFGLEVELAPRLALTLAGAWSRNSYRSDPQVEIRSDKDGTPVDAARSGLKGYRLGGSPERVASLRLGYRGARMWTVSATANLVSGYFVSPNPLRRMRRAYDRAESPEALYALLWQERLPDAFTVDLFLSKTFRLGHGYLSLSGSLRNVANRRDIVYDGYEPMRIRKKSTGAGQSLEPFASRYRYAYPRTYYLTVQFRF